MTHYDFVTLPSGGQLHYRTIGDGPPLIILHPSPQSSEAMGASMNAFSPICRCFALDTPGYGLSDDMPQSDPNIGDYADIIVDAIDALGISSFILYGAATGSQIAIEIAKRHPDRTKLLMLDANGHVSDEDRARMLEGYFPDVTPRRDGGHLLTYWDMCRNLFFAFPWNSTRPEDRFETPMPPVSVIQDTMLRYLQAGGNYTKAYETAFRIENRAHMDGLNIPTIMTRWQGSPVLSIADALINEGLPECVRLLKAGPTIEERFSVQVEVLQETVATTSFEDIDETQDHFETQARFTKQYLETSAGKILARISKAKGDKPIIILHGTGGSAEQLAVWCDDLIGQRPLVLIDLPGHGGSFRIADPEAITVESFADTVAEAIEGIDLGGADIIGYGLGGAIAVLVGDKVKTSQVIVVDPLVLSDSRKSEFIERGIPDLTPQMDGSHLIKAWAMARDSALFQPWYDQQGMKIEFSPEEIAPAAIHRKTADILRCGALWSVFKRLEVETNWVDILRHSNGNTCFLASGQTAGADNLQKLIPENTERVVMASGPASESLIEMFQDSH